MKYVITGASGHISKPIVLQLLNAKHEVTVIGRSAGNLQELVDKGATAAIGSIEDQAFLTKAFAGADALYVMCPPTYDTPDIKAHYEKLGKIYAAAIKASRVKNVVVLSSIGADQPSGNGPVDGLYRLEQEFNKLGDVNIVYLRPAYFYYNLYANLDLIKHLNITGSNFSAAPGSFPLVHTNDIAAAATEELLHLNFKGHSVRYVVSDEVGTEQIATALGNAIGKPGLPWVKFPDEQALQGMLQAGLGQDIANNYIEMGNAIDAGTMSADYFKQTNRQLGKIKLDDFAKEFAAAFAAANPA